MRVPILAPIRSANICPLGSKERWELRAQPLGCSASTFTVLSVIVTVLGVLTLGGLGVVLVWCVRQAQRRWKDSEYEGIDSSRWRDPGLLVSFVNLFPRWAPGQSDTENGESAETRPLLE